MTNDVIIIDDDDEEPSTNGLNTQPRDDEVVYVGGGGESSTTRGAVTNLEASNDGVGLLQSFGFSRREATNALQLCKGDKDAAAMYLFDGVLPNVDDATISQNRVDTKNKSQHSLENQLMFLLEDPDFYQACYHANRHDRDTASKAILECLTRLSEKKPEFMQIIAANPLELIQLISSIEL